MQRGIRAFTTKNKKERMIPIWYNSLLEFLHSIHEEQGYILNCGESKINKNIISISRKLDIRFSAHSCRHTYASHLILSKKVTIEELAKVLGHENIQITYSTYLHLIGSGLDKKLD